MQNNKLTVAVFQPNIRLYRLLGLWTLGLISGALAGSFRAADYYPLMRRVVLAPVSVVSLFICVILPFAVTIVAGFWDKPWFVYVLSTLKAFSFSYTGSICLICFGVSGWLVRVLLLFTQIATAPALWYIWLFNCQRKKELTFFSFSFLLLYLASIVLLDYYLIAPYLAEAIT